MLRLNSSPSFLKQLKAFKKTFNPNDHGISVKYTFRIPSKFLYTKEGYISSRTGDVDNFVKLSNDFIFNPKTPERAELESLQNIGIDDKFILVIKATKLASLDDSYHVSVRIDIISKKTGYLPNVEDPILSL